MGQRNRGGIDLTHEPAIPAPTLLTVVLNYRTPELTLQASDAVLRAMHGLPGKLIIVDNDSGDGSFERILEAAESQGWTLNGRVEVLRAGQNGGFGAGNNFGIRAGLTDGLNPDFIYILNSDAFPDAGAIQALLTHLQTHPGTGLAGSYIHGPDGTPHTTAFRFPGIASEFEGAACTGVISRLLRRHVVSLPMPQTTCRVDWLAGASLMIRAEVLDRIGLFDEKFFLYFEETDLCRRARSAGWFTDYVRESTVAHIGSVSTGMKNWTRTPGYWFDSRHHYFTKTHGRVYAALATAAHVAGGLLYRVRSLVGRIPRLDPPYFLRDLARHGLRQFGMRLPRTMRAEPDAARPKPRQARSVRM